MEIWKDIPGYENLYQASSTGAIKALERKVKSPRGYRTARERIIKQANCGGYLLVMLCKNGARNNYLAHRLIALTFLDNQYNKPCVNHIDGDKKNNNVTNLEWCTYSENEIHSYKILNKIQPKGQNHRAFKHGKYCST